MNCIHCGQLATFVEVDAISRRFCDLGCQIHRHVLDRFNFIEMKRERLDETFLTAWNGTEKMMSFLLESETSDFFQQLSTRILNEICHGKIFDYIDEIVDALNKNELSYFFFDKNPESAKDILNHLVGVVKMSFEPDGGHIDILCSKGGFGRLIFLWLVSHYDTIQVWKIDALPTSMVFWLKLGFQFDTLKDYNIGETKTFFLHMYEKHGDLIFDWLSGDDLKDTQDVKLVRETAYQFYDMFGLLFPMIWTRVSVKK